MPSNELVESSSVGTLKAQPCPDQQLFYLPVNWKRLFHKSSPDLPVSDWVLCHNEATLTVLFYLLHNTWPLFTFIEVCESVCKTAHTGPLMQRWDAQTVASAVESKGMEGWLLMKTLFYLDILAIEISTPAVFHCSWWFFVVFKLSSLFFFLAELALGVLDRRESELNFFVTVFSALWL